MSLEFIQRWASILCHRRKARVVKKKVTRAFTAHPEATGETYFEHLWFTIRFATRFVYSGTVIVIHGIFPFFFERTASLQLEYMYRVMKSRIPAARLEEIDHEFEYHI